MDTGFCMAALEAVLGKGRPEIFNTDQGAQFTSEAFTRMLQEQRVQVSMDGKGRYLDNIFVDGIKYEGVSKRSPRPELGMLTWSSTTSRGLTRLWATGLQPRYTKMARKGRR